jgi:hypothetical protein
MAKSEEYRIQGRVSKKEYLYYKKLKAEFSEEMNISFLDGQFISYVLHDWEKLKNVSK